MPACRGAAAGGGRPAALWQWALGAAHRTSSKQQQQQRHHHQQQQQRRQQRRRQQQHQHQQQRHQRPQQQCCLATAPLRLATPLPHMPSKRRPQPSHCRLLLFAQAVGHGKVEPMLCDAVAFAQLPPSEMRYSHVLLKELVRGWVGVPRRWVGCAARQAGEGDGAA